MNPTPVKRRVPEIPTTPAWARALALVLLLAAPATAAGPAGSVATQALRAQTAATLTGLEQGRSSTVVVTDPAKAERAGLSGLAAGDAVTVTRTGDGKWSVSHPPSGRTATLDHAPDL